MLPNQRPSRRSGNLLGQPAGLSKYTYLLPGLLTLDSRRVPPHVRRLQYYVTLIIAVVGLSIYAFLFAFFPSGQAPVAGGAQCQATVFHRRFDRQLLVVEPASLGGDRYLIVRGSAGDGAGSAQVDRVSTGVYGLFGGAVYVAFVEPQLSAALDTNDSGDSQVTETAGDLTFQDASDRQVTVIL